MHPSTAQIKEAIRKGARERVKALTEAQKIAASVMVRQRLVATEPWQKARTVLLYAPLSDEVDVWPLLDEGLGAGKRMALPRYAPEEQAYVASEIISSTQSTAPGRFGIREPHCSTTCLALNQLDLVLVPGVAFGLDGARVGRGKGFYDRLLASVTGAKCGVGFEEQLQPGIPLEPHDIILDCLITPARWLQFGRPPVLK